MKKLLLSAFMINIIPLIVFGQTKKERIETLTYKMDSLNMVVAAQMNEINSNDSMILDLNGQIRTLNSTLDKKTLEINILKESNNKKDQEIQKNMTDIHSKDTLILDLDNQIRVFNTALEKRNLEESILKESNSKKDQEIQRKNEVIMDLEQEVKSLRDAIKALKDPPQVSNNTELILQAKSDSLQKSTLGELNKISDAKLDVQFKFKDDAIDEDTGIPSSKIYLSVSGKEIYIATIQAGAEIIEKSDFPEYDIPKNALSACGGWWAGFGDYFYIIESKSSITVYQGWQEEGDPDLPDYGFHWEKLKEIAQ